MKKTSSLSPILIFLIGLLLLLIPAGIIKTVIRGIGILIIGLGVLKILENKKQTVNNSEMIYVVLMTFLGIIFLLNPEAIAGIIPFTLGIWIVIKTLFRLNTLRCLPVINKVSLILNIVALIIGITMIFNPFSGAEALLRIIGIVMMIYAVLEFIDYKETKPKEVKVIK